MFWIETDADSFHQYFIYPCKRNTIFQSLIFYVWMMIMIITLEINSNQFLDATRFLLRKLLWSSDLMSDPWLYLFIKLKVLNKMFILFIQCIPHNCCCLCKIKSPSFNSNFKAEFLSRLHLLNSRKIITHTFV